VPAELHNRLGLPSTGAPKRRIGRDPRSGSMEEAWKRRRDAAARAVGEHGTKDTQERGRGVRGSACAPDTIDTLPTGRAAFAEAREGRGGDGRRWMAREAEIGSQEDGYGRGCLVAQISRGRGIVLDVVERPWIKSFPREKGASSGDQPKDYLTRGPAPLRHNHVNPLVPDQMVT